MKTTIDLPEDLIRRLKLRALRDGKKLKELAADLLRRGLNDQSPPARLPPAVIVKDKKTGLPVIQCDPAPLGQELTPDEVARILIEQESEWARGVSDPG